MGRGSSYNIPRRRKTRIAAIGDLDQRIKIQVRSLTPPAQGSIDFTSSFTDTVEVWAMVETVRSQRLFDGIEMRDGITHEFNIRYQQDLDQESWIEYKNERYDIVDVENYDERNRFMKIQAIKHGKKTAGASVEG